MRVLMLHNHYQLAGGEDAVVASERAMLEAHGHTVRLLETNNDGIQSFGAKVKAALDCIYSPASRRVMEKELRRFRPDVVHAHNIFPVLSPAALYACSAAGVACVYTLHNYRWVCPGSLLFREGANCEECLSKRVAYPGVLHGCYRGSPLGTVAVAAMSTIHRGGGFLERNVTRFIALSEFSRAKFVEGGFSAAKLSVKPNFLDRDPGAGDGAGGYALYAGRLTEEKGIGVLLDAWRTLGNCIPLKIVGTGPMLEKCKLAAQKCSALDCLGLLTPGEVAALMGRATALIAPSLCYENLPRIIVESFAAGTPVIASKLGALAEIVEHGRTGLHFAPGGPAALAEQVEWMLAHPAEWSEMRLAARKEFESKYTAERNHSMLMEIYGKAIAARS